jgi:hypothetical protein
MKESFREYVIIIKKPTTQAREILRKEDLQDRKPSNLLPEEEN